MKAVGIVLIVIGILMFVVPSISYTEKKTIVDVGPIEINANEKNTIGWPVYAGGFAVAAGVVVLVLAYKKK